MPFEERLQMAGKGDASPGGPDIVWELYAELLRRPPTQHEVNTWSRALAGQVDLPNLLRSLLRSEEFRRKRGVTSIFPAGHYYSPVVDPNTVADYVAAQRKLDPGDIPALTIVPSEMFSFWKSNLNAIRAVTFPDAPSPQTRFHYQNGSFPYGDAIMLRAIMTAYRPNRIVEVGSGYTTACMLDVADEIGLNEICITCIEPYADRLRGLLRLEDWRRVSLIETIVQEVPLAVVTHLKAGDILFIDSTHVLKTGSDVHFEILKMLPAVCAGVLVHFHDVPFPFEYPNEWIFSANHSWNEACVLQAFLMYNEAFRIVMWNSLLARYYSKDIQLDFPLFLKNPGGSLWLMKTK